jgi:sec-independent protein translocase protein TatB
MLRGMLNIGPLELLAIGVVALLVLGPEKLPGAVRTVGRVFGELRRISTGFQNELRDAFEQSEFEQQMKARAKRRQPAGRSERADPAIDQPDGSSADDLADDESAEPNGATDPTVVAAETSEPGTATEPSPEDVVETSGPGVDTEPTATEATEAAASGKDDNPGKDDEGASQSHSDQDDSETPRTGGPAPAGS